MARIKINSDIIKKCCKEALLHYETEKEIDIETKITYLMNKKWFKCKTREDALETINHNPGCYELSIRQQIDYPYDFIIRQINNLQKMSEYSDEVWLDEDDLFILNFNENN